VKAEMEIEILFSDYAILHFRDIDPDEHDK